MFRFLMAALAAFFVCACVASPAPAPTPSPSPSAVDAASQMTVAPVPAIAPGSTTIKSPWIWEVQGPPSDGLEAAVAKLATPKDIADYLLKNHRWQDDYDIRRFLSPDEMIARGKAGGVCTAHARFWCYALARQGRRSVFLALYGSKAAHAVAVFQDEQGVYRCASNQYLYADDLDPGRLGSSAAIGAAAVIFEAQLGVWTAIEVFDPVSGQITQRLINEKNTGVPQVAIEPGRNLFSIRR